MKKFALAFSIVFINVTCQPDVYILALRFSSKSGMKTYNTGTFVYDIIFQQKSLRTENRRTTDMTQMFILIVGV